MLWIHCCCELITPFYNNSSRGCIALRSKTPARYPWNNFNVRVLDSLSVTSSDFHCKCTVHHLWRLCKNCPIRCLLELLLRNEYIFYGSYRYFQPFICVAGKNSFLHRLAGLQIILCSKTVLSLLTHTFTYLFKLSVLIFQTIDKISFSLIFTVTKEWK